MGEFNFDCSTYLHSLLKGQSIIGSQRMTPVALITCKMGNHASTSIEKRTLVITKRFPNIPIFHDQRDNIF